MKILYRYFLKEISFTVFVCFSVLTFVVLTAKIFTFTDTAIRYGASISQIIKIFLLLIPEVILFSFPAALLISVLIVFLKSSSDNEIIALKSSGISFYQLLPPVILISAFSSSLAFAISMFAVPWGNREIKKIFIRLLKEKTEIGIKERMFCEPFKGIVFYVNSFFPKEKIMKKVFVVDRRSEEFSTIIAEEARIIRWKKAVILHFSKGTLFSTDKSFEKVRIIQFESYDLSLNLKRDKDVILKMKPKEMDLSELLKGIKEENEPIKRNLMIIELMERISLPFGVFLMGLIGAPLGMQIKTKSKPVGITVGLAVFFIYYTLLAGAKSISETGFISPYVGIWIPDILLVILNIIALKKTEKRWF